MRDIMHSIRSVVIFASSFGFANSADSFELRSYPRLPVIIPYIHGSLYRF